MYSKVFYRSKFSSVKITTDRNHIRSFATSDLTGIRYGFITLPSCILAIDSGGHAYSSGPEVDRQGLLTV